MFFLEFSYVYPTDCAKAGVTGKQSTSDFPENEHFLPPDTHTHECVRA